MPRCQACRVMGCSRHRHHGGAHVLLEWLIWLLKRRKREGQIWHSAKRMNLDLISQVHKGLSTWVLEEGRVILKFSMLSLSFNLIGQSQVFEKMMCNFKIRFGSNLVSFRLVHTSQPPAARQIGAFFLASDPRTGQHTSCLSLLQLKTEGKATWEDVSRIHFQFQMSTSTTRLHFNRGGIVRI